MPDEPTPNEQTRKWGAMERDALYLLTDPARYPTIWSVPEIGRQLD